MTTAATLTLQIGIKNLTTTLATAYDEARDLIALYNSGPASDISGLSNGDPVCQEAKLTKLAVVNGIFFCSEFSDFFGNAAVTTGDYMATLHALTYGSATLVSPISSALEGLGSRLATLATTLIAARRAARQLASFYYASEIGAAVGAIDLSTVLFGCDATKNEILLGISVTEQFAKMLGNEAVTTGDYASILAAWTRL